MFSGEIKKSDLVFYNPQMVLNRHISILAISEFQKETKRELVYGDVFSASGVRGIRAFKEIKGIKEVVFNDLNKTAIELIKENLGFNGIKEGYKIYNEDASSLLHKYRFLIDVVDIDPFGSPAYYLDASARAVTNKGMVMITATDTAPLSGTYPKTCLRRYHSKPLRIDTKHDIGLRILVKEIAYSLSVYDKAFVPLISYSHLHYFRVIGKIIKSKTKATEVVKNNIGYFNYCSSCGFKSYSQHRLNKCPLCGSNLDYAGKLWIKEIGDPDFVKNILKNPLLKEYNDKKLEKLLNILAEEYGFKGNYYNVHELSKIKGMTPPRLKELIKRIENRGYNVARSHYGPLIIKTDMPLEEMKEIM